MKKGLIIAIIVAACLTLCNIGAIIYLDHVADKPLSSYSVDVLGAVFKDTPEEGVIDVNLVRPPRVAVFPGETSEQNSTLTNDADFSIYLRAAYRVEIRDGENNIVEDFDEHVIIDVHGDWLLKDGYFYYQGAVEAGESIPGPIRCITYSPDFAAHIDYKVYVPVLIESVQAVEDIENVDYWPEQDINKVGIENKEKTTWTTKVMIK